MTSLSCPERQAAPTTAPTQTIHVLLADDHPVTLWGLRQLVSSAQPRMSVSGTAKSCQELMQHPALEQAHLVLMDLGLQDGSALGCIQPLVTERGVQVVVLTGEINLALHREAVMRGARGVVLKSQPAEQVLMAIERVHAGEVWLDGSLMSMLLGGLPGMRRSSGSSRGETFQRIKSLTPKERQVVQAVVAHRGAKGLVVADYLGMSENTLRNHLTVIYSKLGVQGKLDLYAFALEHGLAPVSEASIHGPLTSF